MREPGAIAVQGFAGLESPPKSAAAITLLIALPILSIAAAFDLILAVDFRIFWSAANANVGALYHSEFFVNPPSALIWILIWPE